MKKIKYITFPLIIFATILASEFTLFAAEEGEGSWPLVLCIDNFVDNRSKINKDTDPISKDDLMLSRIHINSTGLEDSTKDGNCVNLGDIEEGAKATVQFKSKDKSKSIDLKGLEDINIWTNAPKKTLVGTGILDDKIKVRVQLTVWTNLLDNDKGFEKIIEIHNVKISDAPKEKDEG